MINRDGSESNGYFGSKDHIEDTIIADGNHIGDELAKELGFWFFIIHRIQMRAYILHLRLRRYKHRLFAKAIKRD